MLRACVFIALVALGTGSVINRASAHMLRQGSYRGGVDTYGFARTLAFKHRLRICNAYPYNGAIDIYRGRERMTAEAPVPYKGCRDFLSPLKAGDKLNFKVNDANAGVFSISDLPNNDAVLLLVIHRHDTLSTAVSFESHVFANLLNAQVAVIDTYKGIKQAKLKITDGAPTFVKDVERDAEAEMGEKKKAASQRTEELRYDTVVAVNAGIYQVEMDEVDDDTKKITQPLVALNRESYVVIRTGVEAQQGPKYPQDLMVYPQSDPSIFYPRRSNSPTAATPGLALLLVAVFAMASWLQ